MANWQPYSSVQQAPTISAPPPLPPLLGAATVNCVECGRAFGAADVVRIQNSWVCGACKPVFLQRMIEGAPLPAAADIWRSGKEVVAPKGAIFPDRCVKCNAPVHGWRLKRNLYWHPPYVLLLIVLSLLIGLIVAMIVRQNAKVEIGLCEAHRSKRVRNMIIGAVLTVAGIGLIVAAAIFEKGLLVLFAIAALICGIVFMVQATIISAKRIDSKFVWIKGVCRPFLDMLPEWRKGM
jgi:hypothetical protein